MPRFGSPAQNPDEVVIHPVAPQPSIPGMTRLAVPPTSPFVTQEGIQPLRFPGETVVVQPPRPEIPLPPPEPRGPRCAHGVGCALVGTRDRVKTFIFSYIKRLKWVESGTYRLAATVENVTETSVTIGYEISSTGNIPKIPLESKFSASFERTEATAVGKGESWEFVWKVDELSALIRQRPVWVWEQAIECCPCLPAAGLKERLTEIVEATYDSPPPREEGLGAVRQQTVEVGGKKFTLTQTLRRGGEILEDWWVEGTSDRRFCRYFVHWWEFLDFDPTDDFSRSTGLWKVRWEGDELIEKRHAGWFDDLFLALNFIKSEDALIRTRRRWNIR